MNRVIRKVFRVGWQALSATVLLATICHAEPVVIRSGNVIEPPAPGGMPHHMLQTQLDFAKLMSWQTDGEIELQILEGKREDIPAQWQLRRRTDRS